MKRKIATKAAVTAGAFVVAGVGATVLNDRLRNRRHLRRGEDVAFGSVHSAPISITGHDGVAINVEVDDGPLSPTVVFLHGWMCTLDTWHYQRVAMRGNTRLILVDHRSHGGSARAHPADSSLQDLAEDLAIVLDRLVPKGPIVLVGHSMGGMTIQQLAIDSPEWFDKRVKGVALIGTSGGQLVRSSPALRRMIPVLRRMNSALDWGRAFNSYSVMRRWAVGPNAEPKHVDMVDEMILRAPSRVIWDFHHNFVGMDLTAGHKTLGKARTVVVGGRHDMLTPYKHSLKLVEDIPGAELVTAEKSGHMMMFEEHELVTQTIEQLVEQVRAG